MSNFNAIINRSVGLNSFIKIEHVDRKDLEKVVVVGNYVDGIKKGEEVLHELKAEVNQTMLGTRAGEVVFDDSPDWVLPFEYFEVEREGAKDNKAKLTITFYNPTATLVAKDSKTINLSEVLTPGGLYRLFNGGSEPVFFDVKSTFKQETNTFAITNESGDRETSFNSVPIENLSAKNITNNTYLKNGALPITNPYPKLPFGANTEQSATTLKSYFPYKPAKGEVASYAMSKLLERPSAKCYYRFDLNFAVKNNEVYYENYSKKRISDTMEGRFFVGLVDERNRVYAGVEVNRVARDQVNVDFVFDGGIHQTAAYTDASNPFNTGWISFDVNGTNVTTAIKGRTVSRNIPALAGRKVAKVYMFTYQRVFEYPGIGSRPASTVYPLVISASSYNQLTIHDWRVEGGTKRFKVNDVAETYGGYTAVNGKRIPRESSKPSPILAPGENFLKVLIDPGATAEILISYKEVRR